MASRFNVVQKAAPIETFQLSKVCADDPFKNKVDLTIGAYRDDNGCPWVLPVVRKTEELIANDKTLLHEYLPILGIEEFSRASVALLLGKGNPAIVEERAFGIQTLSGTGGLRVGAEFLKEHLNCTTFYYSDPTWENHHHIFVSSGFTRPRKYRYWDCKTRTVDFQGFIEDLKSAPENAVIILHASGHNPTGIDPTHEQWVKIADVMEMSNNEGKVAYVDCRGEEPLWTVQAHEKEVTGLILSDQVPGLMITASTDGTLKTWDITSACASQVSVRSSRAGQCLCVAACPDAPLSVALGGDNKQCHIELVDLTANEQVANRFGPRLTTTAPPDPEESMET